MPKRNKIIIGIISAVILVFAGVFTYLYTQGYLSGLAASWGGSGGRITFQAKVLNANNRNRTLTNTDMGEAMLVVNDKVYRQKSAKTDRKGYLTFKNIEAEKNKPYALSILSNRAKGNITGIIKRGWGYETATLSVDYADKTAKTNTITVSYNFTIEGNHNPIELKLELGDNKPTITIPKDAPIYSNSITETGPGGGFPFRAHINNCQFDGHLDDESAQYFNQTDQRTIASRQNLTESRTLAWKISCEGTQPPPNKGNLTLRARKGAQTVPVSYYQVTGPGNRNYNNLPGPDYTLQNLDLNLEYTVCVKVIPEGYTLQSITGATKTNDRCGKLTLTSSKTITFNFTQTTPPPPGEDQANLTIIAEAEDGGRLTSKIYLNGSEIPGNHAGYTFEDIAIANGHQLCINPLNTDYNEIDEQKSDDKSDVVNFRKYADICVSFDITEEKNYTITFVFIRKIVRIKVRGLVVDDYDVAVSGVELTLRQEGESEKSATSTSRKIDEYNNEYNFEFIDIDKNKDTTVELTRFPTIYTSVEPRSISFNPGNSFVYEGIFYISYLAIDKKFVLRRATAGDCSIVGKVVVKDTYPEEVMPYSRVELYLKVNPDMISSTETDEGGEFYFDNFDCDLKYQVDGYPDGVQYLKQLVDVSVTHDLDDITNYNIIYLYPRSNWKKITLRIGTYSMSGQAVPGARVSYELRFADRMEQYEDCHPNSNYHEETFLYNRWNEEEAILKIMANIPESCNNVAQNFASEENYYQLNFEKADDEDFYNLNIRLPTLNQKQFKCSNDLGIVEYQGVVGNEGIVVEGPKSPGIDYNPEDLKNCLDRHVCCKIEELLKYTGLDLAGVILYGGGDFQDIILGLRYDTAGDKIICYVSDFCLNNPSRFNSFFIHEFGHKMDFKYGDKQSFYTRTEAGKVWRDLFELAKTKDGEGNFLCGEKEISDPKNPKEKIDIPYPFSDYSFWAVEEFYAEMIRFWVDERERMQDQTDKIKYPDIDDVCRNVLIAVLDLFSKDLYASKLPKGPYCTDAQVQDPTTNKFVFRGDSPLITSLLSSSATYKISRTNGDVIKTGNISDIVEDSSLVLPSTDNDGNPLTGTYFVTFENIPSNILSLGTITIYYKDTGSPETIVQTIKIQAKPNSDPRYLIAYGEVRDIEDDKSVTGVSLGLYRGNRRLRTITSTGTKTSGNTDREYEASFYRAFFSECRSGCTIRADNVPSPYLTPDPISFRSSDFQNHASDHAYYHFSLLLSKPGTGEEPEIGQTSQIMLATDNSDNPLKNAKVKLIDETNTWLISGFVGDIKDDSATGKRYNLRLPSTDKEENTLYGRYYGEFDSGYYPNNYIDPGTIPLLFNNNDKDQILTKHQDLFVQEKRQTAPSYLIIYGILKNIYTDNLLKDGFSLGLYNNRGQKIKTATIYDNLKESSNSKRKYNFVFNQVRYSDCQNGCTVKIDQKPNSYETYPSFTINSSKYQNYNLTSSGSPGNTGLLWLYLLPKENNQKMTFKESTKSQITSSKQAPNSNDQNTKKTKSITQIIKNILMLKKVKAEEINKETDQGLNGTEAETEYTTSTEEIEDTDYSDKKKFFDLNEWYFTPEQISEGLFKKERYRKAKVTTKIKIGWQRFAYAYQKSTLKRVLKAIYDFTGKTVKGREFLQGNLKFKVVDMYGNPIPDAVATIANSSGISNNEGIIEITNIDRGTHRLTLSAKIGTLQRIIKADEWMNYTTIKERETEELDDIEVRPEDIR